MTKKKNRYFKNKTNFEYVIVYAIAVPMLVLLTTYTVVFNNLTVFY